MIQLDKVKIGQVIKTLYSPGFAEKNDIIGHLNIKISSHHYLNVCKIHKDGIFPMKSNFAYEEATFEDSYDIEMGDINLVPLEKIRETIEKVFK